MFGGNQYSTLAYSIQTIPPVKHGRDIIMLWCFYLERTGEMVRINGKWDNPLEIKVKVDIPVNNGPYTYSQHNNDIHSSCFW